MTHAEECHANDARCDTGPLAGVCTCDAPLRNARERADAFENAVKLFKMGGLGVTFVDENKKVDLDTLFKMVEKFTDVINERNPKDWT